MVLAVSIPTPRRGDDARGPGRLRRFKKHARPARQGRHHVGRGGDLRDHPPAAVRLGRACRTDAAKTSPRLRRLDAGRIASSFPTGSRSIAAKSVSRRPIRSTRSLLSVFERKWQALPRFQQTRGILRLLALWVSTAYPGRAIKEAHKDPLIGLGTAPLDDPMFRTAVFEQLGEQRLEAAVTTDICGKKDSHAMRLDAEAVDTIKKARLHRKVATVVFFESNGGQAEERCATVPEIRLAVAEPDLDIGNIETALEALGESCYYLRVERNKYRFGLAPNLNKLLADRRAGIDAKRVDERSAARY